jgi:hypothetical protein
MSLSKLIGIVIALVGGTGLAVGSYLASYDLPQPLPAASEAVFMEESPVCTPRVAPEVIEAEPRPA